MTALVLTWRLHGTLTFDLGIIYSIGIEMTILFFSEGSGSELGWLYCLIGN